MALAVQLATGCYCCRRIQQLFDNNSPIYKPINDSKKNIVFQNGGKKLGT